MAPFEDCLCGAMIGCGVHSNSTDAQIHSEMWKLLQITRYSYLSFANQQLCDLFEQAVRAEAIDD